MASHNLCLELQKETVSASVLNNLGLSAGSGASIASSTRTKPITILFTYPTPEMAQEALAFFSCFVIILRGRKITFSARTFTPVTQESVRGSANPGCSILLVEEHEGTSAVHATVPTSLSAAAASGVSSARPSEAMAAVSTPVIATSMKQSDKLVSRLPSAPSSQPPPRLSVLHLGKNVTELNDVSSQLSEANTPHQDRPSRLNLSGSLSTRSARSLHSVHSEHSACSYRSGHISLAESVCAPDTPNRYHVAISNIALSMTSANIIGICRQFSLIPLEDAPVILEATLETASHRIYTVQRSMTLSFADLATAMLCRDVINAYVIEEETDTTLVAKIVDKQTKERVHTRGVLVRNVPRVVSQNTFLRAMRTFGEMLSCRFVRGTRRSTGFGAIIYENPKAANEAKKSGLDKIKEVTIQVVEERKAAKIQKEQQAPLSAVQAAPVVQTVPVAAVCSQSLRNSVSFGAASAAGPAMPPVLVASLNPDSDDSINDVIRAIVEANNRLIMSREASLRAHNPSLAEMAAQMKRLDLLYTAIHNHHVPAVFSSKYQTLVSQAQDDERLLEFLHNNAILHGIGAVSSKDRGAVVDTLQRGWQQDTGYEPDSLPYNTFNDAEHSHTVELDAQQLNLEFTGDTTITTDI